MKFIFSQIGVMTAGGAYTLKKATIEEFPFVENTKEAQKPFIDLVVIILAKKEKGEDITAEKKAIDQMVYRLYDLTAEEKRIVEGE